MRIAQIRPLFRALALLALTGLLACLIVNSVHESRRATVLFPDGSRFTLVATLVGGQEMWLAKPWRNLVRNLVLRFLPSKRYSLPSSYYAFTCGCGGSNDLTVCFTLVDATGTNLDFSPFEVLAVPVADDNFEFAPARETAQCGHDERGAEVHAFVLKAFPRRQADFALQFHRIIDPMIYVDPDTGQDVTNETPPLAFSIRVRNPFRGTFPQWTPQRLPVTRTNGPLKVTLHDVVNHRASPTNAAFLSWQWKMETTDRLWQHALSDHQQWSDVTGNRVESDATNNLADSLDDKERAWKLRLEFQRDDPADYSASEKFDLPGLTLPGPGTFQVLTNEFERLARVSFGSGLGQADVADYLPLYAFVGDFPLWAQLRTAEREAAYGVVEALEKIVAAIRKRCRQARIIVRGDSGFGREEIMAWCEGQQDVYYCLGLAKNSVLIEKLGPSMVQARTRYCLAGSSSVRVFTEFEYRTHVSWSRSRRVIGKAEVMTEGENPRFVVTNLPAKGFKQDKDPTRFTPARLYEELYCARGDMENLLKQQVLDLKADRMSTQYLASNQFRLWESMFAYLLLERLRTQGLAATELERATAGSLRLKLLKVAAQVHVSVRRVYVQLSSTFPLQELFRLCHRRLMRLAQPTG